MLKFLTAIRRVPHSGGGKKKILDLYTAAFKIRLWKFSSYFCFLNIKSLTFITSSTCIFSLVRSRFLFCYFAYVHGLYRYLYDSRPSLFSAVKYYTLVKLICNPLHKAHFIQFISVIVLCNKLKKKRLKSFKNVLIFS